MFGIFLPYFEGCCVFLSCRRSSLSQYKVGFQNPHQVLLLRSFAWQMSYRRHQSLVAAIRSSPFTFRFRRVFRHFFMVFFSATGTPNSRNHSFIHYSLPKSTGEWFNNHSNHIHRFTPITRKVATKHQSGPSARKKRKARKQDESRAFLGLLQKTTLISQMRPLILPQQRQSRNYTPVRNCCKNNSENWHAIFQAK